MVKGEEKKENKIMIKFENVSKTYNNDFLALENINLEIKSGEFLSVVGSSGSGKSTLLKMIFAEEVPTGGIVYFDGQPINELGKRKIPAHRRNIGTVFQDSKLLPKKTAYENVAYALEVAGVDDEEIKEDVPQILDIVGLGEKMNFFPYQLSGGEQQKVAMARALIHKPAVIVADEPTGNLDPVSSMEIINLLLKINELGTTIVLASHDKYIVDHACKRVVVLDKGKITNDYAKAKYKICV